VRAHCGYCSQEITAPFVGCTTTRHLHERNSPDARKIRPDHLVFFHNAEEALARGFERATRTAPVP
jgi:methylphosphotriester-DNA--protein-cysteine methyltransferase